MKRTAKILGFIAILAIVWVGGMSTVTTYSGEQNVKVDSFTLANSTSHTDTLRIKGGNAAFGFDFYVKKNSGTLGGNIKVYSSCDASGWRMTSAPLYTATLSDADTNLRYRSPYNPDTKYFVTVTQSGTTNATYSIHLVNRDK